MVPFVLRPRLAESTFSHGIAMNGVVYDTFTDPTVAKLYWHFLDEPATEPQYLGTQSIGHELSVPFDLQGRAIVIAGVAVTAGGIANVQRLSEAKQTVFYPFAVASLTDTTFDSGTDDVTGTITNNGGGGDIHILRSIDGGDFAEIDVVSPVTTGFTDSPVVNGDYTYKLTQDGLPGESNSQTVAVNVGSAPAGTPPDGLTAIYDDVDTISLAWTNHGGTASNVIEGKTNTGGNIWSTRATVSSGTAAWDDTPVNPLPVNVLYTYRVRNESVAGYSNEGAAVVPHE